MESCKELCCHDPHWESVFYTEKREMLMIFMGLQRQGLIRPHFTMHDMMEYLAYQEREAFVERSCQMTGTVDGPSCLIWEVKVLMQLLDIQRDIDLELLEAKENLPAGLLILSETSSSPSPSLKAVEVAVKIMGYRFIYRPFAHEHYLSEIVVDVVARLVHAIETNQGEEAHHALSLFLRGKAGSIAVEVLKKLPQDKMAYYTHLTAVRMVQSLQRKLKSTEMIKMTASGDSDGLMAVLTSVILAKFVKHFCSCSVPLESTDMLTLLLKASERKPPTASMKLVIHADTVICVLVLVLRLIFPDEDDVAVQLYVWPVLDEVVDRLAMCDGKVTRNHRKANLYIHIKEMIQMAQTIYDQLLDGSGSQTVLQYAVSARARMATRDLAGFVTEAILKVHQKRLENLVSAAEKNEPFLHQTVLRDLVARFVYQLFPVSDSLLQYFQLADQLCALIQQDTIESSAFPQALEAMQQSTVTVIQEIARECYSGYLQDFPVRDDWDIDSFLTDDVHCKQTSGMIVKSLLHHFKDLLAPPEEETEDQNVEEPEASLTNVVDQTDGHLQDNECAVDMNLTTEECDSTSLAPTISEVAHKKSRGFFRRLWRACCCCCCSQEAD